MRRLKDYLKLITWQSGLSYLALWAVTFWTLDEGALVFGNSGVCHPDEAKVLFYWVCDPSSPLSWLASIANVALTATVWAPVYVAAASVQSDAMAIAVPIVAVHVIGLPLGLFVLMRMMATALDLRRRFPGNGQPHAVAGLVAAMPIAASASPTAIGNAGAPPLTKPVRKIKARHEFGLRSRTDDRSPPPAQVEDKRRR